MDNEFPEKEYLIAINQDLADEDSVLVYHVISGKEVQSFISQEFNISFSNLSDCVSLTSVDIMPITKCEKKILDKFRILGRTGGHAFPKED